MKDLIKKWWNRKWSDWQEDREVTKTLDGREIGKYLVLKRVSNDGIVQLKKIKIFEV